MAQETAAAAPEPIFVIALPKSYTSILGGILGQHPGIMSVPELNLFVGDTVADWAVQPGYNIFCDGLLRTVAQLEFGAQTEATVAEALAFLQARADWPVAQVFDLLRDRAAPEILLDQSPIYTQKPAFLKRVLEAYPNARFIHLLRNPVSWVNSIYKWQVGEQILEMFIEADIGLSRRPEPVEIWHAVHTGIDALFADLRPEQTLTVWGEDVVTKPAEATARILDWLGLEHTPELLLEMQHPERSIFAGWGPLGARGGNNPDFLTDPRLRTRDDRDRLMRIDTGAMPVPEEVLSYARSVGYA